MFCTMSIVYVAKLIVHISIQFYSLDTLDKLQLARNPEDFDAASTLFMAKWRVKYSKLIDDYFESEWLTKNRNWYEGFRIKTPSTNNALESFNNVIKNEHTMRERLDISQFRVVLFKMIEQWSVEYTSNLNSINNGAPKIDLSLWTSGYNFARSNVKIKSKRHADEITYNIPVGDASEADSICEDSSQWKTFKEFVRSFEMVHTTFNYPLTSANWSLGRCDCEIGFKQYLCEHIVGVALRLKVVEAPAEAKALPLGQKRKRGRPAKSKPALEHQ